MSPMMSKGPASVFLLFQSGAAANRHSNQLFRRVEDADMPKPLALEVTHGFP